MKTYTIKPLKWEDFAPKHQFRSSNAEALPLVRTYFVRELNYDRWSWQIGLEPATLVDTVAAGKAAAEAHYIQQMEKGLETTP